jgi:predicted O-linked N-acetylglucosamine transferase (SPINDLY family)
MTENPAMPGLEARLREAVAQLNAGRADAAAAMLERLPAAAADTPAVQHWLGVTRLRQGRLAEARELIERAVRGAPREAVYHANLGAVLLRCGRPGEAAVALRQALALRPGMASAHNNLANALRALGEVDGAGEHYRAALALDDRLPEAHNNLANIRKEQGDVPAALAGYRRALELRPDLREAFSNLLALLRLSDAHTPEEVHALHLEFAERFERPLRTVWPVHPNPPEAGRRLRVGYLSPDCHPAALFFLRPVWARHDREQVEVFTYFDAPPPADPPLPAGLTVRVLRGLTDAQVAEQVRADGIDILLDIAGHVGHSRILSLARKPAPVQVEWLDYLGSTGLAAMDYRLTDRLADPPGAEAMHSERLLRMPEPYCQWCYPGTLPLEEGESPQGRNGYLTFGSFNHQVKLTPRTLALWQRLLDALPTARLRLLGVDSAVAREAVRHAFAARGQAGRIELLPRLAYPEFLVSCQTMDIALDPLLFSGATTTCDVLWMGVPVITLPGASSASRSTAAILSTLGLEEFVADSEEAYLDIARRWSARPDALAALRRGLRERMQASPLMDAVGFTRALEALLRQCWREWCGERGGGHG